jgi:micrococcal nuclease
MLSLSIAIALIASRSRVAAGHDDANNLVLVGTVERVVDGDTLVVMLDSGEIRVRVWGIDAPEHDQPYGAEAKAALGKFVDGHEVELQPANHTSYDRMVARVFVDGKDVDGEMVKRGFAMAERRYLKQFDDGRSYCSLEQSARSSRLGIWGLPADQLVAPWEWRRKKTRTAPFTDYGKATAASCVAEIGKALSP